MDSNYLSIFDILEYARDFNCGNVLGVYFSPASQTKEDFFYCYGMIVLLDVVNLVRDGGTLELYVRRIRSPKARLTSGETSREANEPPPFAIAASNVGVEPEGIELESLEPESVEPKGFESKGVKPKDDGESNENDSTDEYLVDCTNEEEFLATLFGSNVDEELRNARDTARELKRIKGKRRMTKLLILK
ncbi:hypothetical protein GH714_030644 [Hevea brasiliensis]|uniref:Uncharacterized protein n=1 Tax=Hevea brasiliensis TaxID=3981 RepID=A0A6A6LPD9_HEVBR|nr:hypothetical protein GH714_030644 [Hevea brasiliensis]